MTTLSVVIGGNDVSSDVISLTTEQDICRVAQTFEVALDPTSSGSFDPWDDVVIAINGTNRLTGYVNEVVKGRVPTEFVVRGMDKMKLALEMFVPNTWTATDMLSEDVEVIGEEQDAGWWIDFWLTEVGITSSGSVETGGIVPVDAEDPITWTYTAVSDIILECLGYAGGGYTVIVDGDGVAQIAEKTIGGGTTHTLNSSNILAFSRSEDDSWLRDRAVVFGATSGSNPIVVEKPDDPAGTTKALALSSDLIKTESRATEIAEAILDFFDDTLDIKRCEVVGDESIWLGDTASVSDSWTGYSGTGLITSIETSIDDRGFRQLVSADEKCGFVWGWGPAAPFEYIDTLLVSGHRWWCAILNGDYGYFGDASYNRRIAKIDLSTFQHVDTLTLAANEKIPASLCVKDGILYVLSIGSKSTKTYPYLVRVDLATFTRTDALALGTTYGSRAPQIIAIDTDTNLMYYARDNTTYLWRIDLTSFLYLDRLQLSDDGHGALLIDIAGGYLYVGADNNYIIKVNLSTFTETAKIRLTPTTTQQLGGSCEDFANNLMYYVGPNAYVYKIDTATFTQIDSVSVGGTLFNIVYDSTGGYLYVGKWAGGLFVIAKIRASDMSYEGDIATGSYNYYSYAAAIDVTNRKAYFGLYSHAGDIIRIGET